MAVYNDRDSNQSDVESPDVLDISELCGFLDHPMSAKDVKNGG